ncbi:MAG: hypothetical protein MSD82_12570 [Prevotella sp.]|nr:hypothetical protein [Prevotella sp.]
MDERSAHVVFLQSVSDIMTPVSAYDTFWPPRAMLWSAQSYHIEAPKHSSAERAITAFCIKIISNCFSDDCRRMLTVRFSGLQGKHEDAPQQAAGIKKGDAFADIAIVYFVRKCLSFDRGNARQNLAFNRF